MIIGLGSDIVDVRRIKEVLDMPFGWPRVADAVRADPRFTEFRLHIWHQLHTAKPRNLRAPREVA